MNKLKPVALSLALAALLAPLSASAIGLGTVSVKSSLYEPLRADVALSINAGEDISGASFVIASPAKFAQAGLPYPAWIGEINARVERSGRSGRLRLSTSKPIYEPMARILIEARLPNGVALLPITLMLDTPFSKPLGSELSPMLPQGSDASSSQKAAKAKAAQAKAAQAKAAKAAKAASKAAAKARSADAPAKASAAPARPAAQAADTAPQRPSAQSEAKADRSAALGNSPSSNEPLKNATPLAPPASSAAAAPGQTPEPSVSAAPAPSVAPGQTAASAGSPLPSASTPEPVSLPAAEEPVAPATAPAPVVASPNPATLIERPVEEPGVFGSIPAWWIWIGGSLALLGAGAASWLRARARRGDNVEELSVSTTEPYSATEEGLGGDRVAPYFEDAEEPSIPPAPVASSFGPSGRAQAPADSFDEPSAPSFELPPGPSLAKAEPDFGDSLGDELSKAVSGGSASAHELEEIDSLRSEVFSSDFRVDSSFDIRSATPLAPMAKTREDFTFESLNEQVAEPSTDTLRPILSDPESFRAPDPESNLMDFEPFHPVSAAAAAAASERAPSLSFGFDEPVADPFSQAEALSQSAQGRSAPSLSLGDAFKVDDSVGECAGRLQLELACLYAQNEDWDGVRSSLKEVIADPESQEAHAEARRLMALIP